MKRIKQFSTFAFTVLWCSITENAVVANHLVLHQYLPDVYHYHYRRIRDHGEVPTRHGRRWQQTETSSSHNSISPEQVDQNKLQQYQQPQIFFHSPNYTVVQAQTRTTAILHCEVTNIGNNTVTWKRRRDYKILTFGMLTYSSDSRFFTRPEKNGKDWRLHIKYVQPDDAGLYECQVTSHPPASVFVDLQLVEARAEIIGGPDKIVKSESPLLLSCVVRRSTEQPEYIFWYHGDRMINYDLEGGVSVRHGRQGSELLIPKADVQHAGNYSCVPSNARSANVIVHILHNEKPAAMQHGSKSSSNSISLNFVSAFIITLVIHHLWR